MEQKNNFIFELLKFLDSNGSKNYLVGGSSRDYLLNIPFTDIDIASNQQYQLTKQYLNKYQLISNNGSTYGNLRYKIEDYYVDITSFRVEGEYIKFCRPASVTYTESLLEDAARRDFTINAIYIDANKKIIDPYNGLNDLSKRLIRIIGEIDYKINQDITRIIRAIRLSLKLAFNIEDDLKKYIIANAELIKKLSPSVLKKQCGKLLSDCEYPSLIMMLEELRLKEYLLDYLLRME